MTPQLQQAIKLLQLSHLEMAEVLRKEMEENPTLEEGEAHERSELDRSSEPESAETRGEAEGDYEASGETYSLDSSNGESEAPVGGDYDAATASDYDQPDYEVLSSNALSSLDGSGGDGGTIETTSVADTSPIDATPEPSTREVEREIDWESYLETYNYALPATAGSGNSDELPPFEATMSQPESLHDHLRWQVQMSEFSEDESMIAVMLIEEVNDDGYLAADAIITVAEELGAPLDAVEVVAASLREFDPPGVASRDLRECLLTQAEKLNADHPLLHAVIDKHLKNVERRNYQAIAKDLKCSLQDVGETVKLISQLEPRPGRQFTVKEPQYITPDIYVYKIGDDYQIVLNEDGLPKLKISNYYRDALQNSGGQTKSFIQEKLRSAVWLIRSIHMRQRTIYRVMESILKFQREFFDSGVQHLRPLILKDVAEDVGMHESTISRVTSNKYVHTPQGIYELKFFFNSSINRMGGESIASESVRDFIKQLIDTENPKSPVSDQQIVELLKKRDIDIARRTVAKYREMLRIPSSSKRKQVF